MLLTEFAMFPTDKGVSVSQYVAKVINIIDKSGLKYQLTPMGTIIEGNFDDTMKVINDCYKILEPECDRIYCSLKFDYRKTEQSRMKSKTEKIQNILGRDLKL